MAILVKMIKNKTTKKAIFIFDWYSKAEQDLVYRIKKLLLPIK